jgi:hypothetical protein
VHMMPNIYMYTQTLNTLFTESITMRTTHYKSIHLISGYTIHIKFLIYLILNLSILKQLQSRITVLRNHLQLHVQIPCIHTP